MRKMLYALKRRIQRLKNAFEIGKAFYQLNDDDKFIRQVIDDHVLESGLAMDLQGHLHRVDNSYHIGVRYESGKITTIYEGNF